MPVYDLACDCCDKQLPNVCLNIGQTMACCSQPMEIVPGRFSSKGILFSDVLDLSEQMDVVLRSNTDRERWQRENPNHRISTNAEWKDMVDKSRHKADKLAQSRGFRHYDEFRSEALKGNFIQPTRKQEVTDDRT